MYRAVNILVGIAGRAGVGKSTAALAIRDYLEMRTYTIAEPITIECARLLHLSHDEFLHLPKNQPLGTIHGLSLSGITKRQLMQHQGRLKRSMNQYALLEDLQNRIHQDEGSNYLFNGSLITDVRMEFEAEWVRKKGGTIVHIHRPSAELAPEDETECTLVFKEEDSLINNSGDLIQFQAKIRTASDYLRHELIENAA